MKLRAISAMIHKSFWGNSSTTMIVLQASIDSSQVHKLSLGPLDIKATGRAVETSIASRFHMLVKFNNQ